LLLVIRLKRQLATGNWELVGTGNRQRGTLKTVTRNR